MTHPGLLRSSNEDVLEAGTILKPDSGGNPTKIHYVIACDGTVSYTHLDVYKRQL